MSGTVRRARWRFATRVAAFALGACGMLSWVATTVGVGLTSTGVLVLTAVFALACAPAETTVGARAVLAAKIALALAYVGCASVTAIFVQALGWWLPTSAIAAVAIAGLVFAYGAVARPAGFRLPFAFPLGLLTVLTAAGWWHEDGLARCDDYFALKRDDRVRLVVPSSRDLETCRSGQSLRLARYPRGVWDDPDGRRFVFTTQQGTATWTSGASPVSDPIGASVCEAVSESSEAPRCVGEAKTQPIIEAPALDRLFVAGWGRLADGHRGLLYALTRRAPLAIVAESRFDGSCGEMFYDADADTITMLCDEADWAVPTRASDLSQGARVRAPFGPGETRYDGVAHEGVACFGAGPLRTIGGEAMSAVAVRGAPFSYRALGGSRRHPLSWLAFTWGCDLDARARRAYVAVASLGTLETIDYDSGEVLAEHFVGFGLRSLVYDRARHRVYASDFLRGEVRAIDPDSGQTLARWFIGRFARRIALARDGGALLATSTLGVVRIDLQAQ